MLLTVCREPIVPEAKQPPRNITEQQELPYAHIPQKESVLGDLNRGNCSDFVRARHAYSHRHTREGGYPQGWGVFISSTLNSYKSRTLFNLVDWVVYNSGVGSIHIVLIRAGSPLIV